MFVKYMHLERLGTAEVEGIEHGTCYVFPKLDGTNGQVWMENIATLNGMQPELMAGSRNRVLSIGNDNAGFYAHCLKQKEFGTYLLKFPNHTLYGEWLVPHSLKTYQDDAWHKFYIFDVFDRQANRWLPYDEYAPLLRDAGLEYLPPLAIIKNGTAEHFLKTLDKNVFLIKDGQGIGEGVVIKNYEFINKFGRPMFAKLISNTFKVQHHLEMGAPIIGGDILEQNIAEEYVTQHFVDKVVAKITVANDGWHPKYIPQLLQTVYYDLITEEMWDILKKNKNPAINFALLQRFTIMRIKELRKDIF